MKRFILAIAACLATTLSLGAAASAEPPERLTLPESFIGINPCSGEAHIVSVTRDLLIIDGDRLVINGSNTGSTSDGYELVNGTLRLVQQGDTVEYKINDMWVGPDGSRFYVHATFTLTPELGFISQDSFDARCLGS